jgi:hypothetical protein
MYGNVDGSSVKTGNAKVRSRRISSTQDEEQMLQDEFEIYSRYLSDPIPVSTIEQPSADGWRLLRKTGTLEHHEKDLGNGYKIQTSILLAL